MITAIVASESMMLIRDSNSLYSSVIYCLYLSPIYPIPINVAEIGKNRGSPISILFPLVTARIIGFTCELVWYVNDFQLGLCLILWKVV